LVAALVGSAPVARCPYRSDDRMAARVGTLLGRKRLRPNKWKKSPRPSELMSKRPQTVGTPNRCDRVKSLVSCVLVVAL